MPFDKNEATISGKIIKLDNVDTRSGTPMIRIRLSCYKEVFNVVAFKETAENILARYEQGDRIQLTGKIQSSSWEKNGVQRTDFQLNVTSFCADDDDTKQQNLYQEDTPKDEHDYQGGPF